ncbi:MAG: DUF480 domain-containing protein [Planctomycetota bacterium]
MDSSVDISSTEPQTSEGTRWTVIGRTERRVLGVLIEKAKTTKDNYPLSLNALRTGCNQKSNRFPQMELEEHHVDEAIDQLRQRGALAIIQGDARVEKYRHLAYEWLGVDKVELAVMGELLLRGAQTIGELRGRAARMEPIKGMSELAPILDRLVQRQLVIYLTPPGRGAVVTHNLYEPKELEKVRRDNGGGAVAEPSAAPAMVATPPTAAPPASPAPTPPPAAAPSQSEDLRAELAALRVEMQEEIATLRNELDSLRQQITG